MRVLITGGFGYLGGRLANYLGAFLGYQIVLGSRYKREVPKWLPQADVVQTFWDSQEELEKICHNIDIIIHASGMNAQECLKNPNLAIKINGEATSCLVKAAVKQKVKRFIYISTAHVYSCPLSGCITEETSLTNSHPYATSHQLAEEAVIKINLKKEMQGIVVRLSNAFGAPVEPIDSCWELIINQITREMVTFGKITLHNPEQVRDFVPMSYVCRAIENMIVCDIKSQFIFNLGYGASFTNHSIAKLVKFIFFNKKNEKSKHAISKSKKFHYNCDKLIASGMAKCDIVDIVDEISRLIKFCRSEKFYRVKGEG